MSTNFQTINKLIKSKQYDIALELINKDINLNHEVIDLFNAKARIFIKQNKVKEAFDLLKDAITYYIPTKGDIEGAVLLSKIAAELGHNIFSRSLDYFAKMTSDKNFSEIQAEIDDNLYNMMENPNYYELACEEAVQRHSTEACIYYAYAKKLGQSSDELDAVILDYQNQKSMLNTLSDPNHTYLLVNNSDTPFYRSKYKVLSQCLANLGKEVYLINPPLVCEVDSPNYDIEVLLEVTKENILENGNIISILPIALSYKDEIILDTTQHIMLDIANSFLKQDVYILFGDTLFLSDLYAHNIPLRKNMQIINNTLYFDEEFFRAPTMSSFCFGSYLHATQIMYPNYQCAFLEELTPDSPKISVVIPASGNPEALKYTLQTCLEQEDFDDYEVLVSDNSKEGDMRTYEVVKSFKDKKLRYVRTPKHLSLGKSFEFAYLNSKGEFIMSIGSDDGLFPYSLKYISAVLDNLPDAGILSWTRLLYMWPNFGAHQSDKFQFPVNSDFKTLNVAAFKSEDLLNSIIDDISKVYILPFGYINSGMRRQNFFKMLEHTGKLLDGLSQDFYTGIVNCFLNPQFYSICVPIAIAGMCNLSIGANSTLNYVDTMSTVKKNPDSAEFYNFENPKNRVFPPFYDPTLFANMLNLATEYFGDKYKLNPIDYKAAVTSLVINMDKNDKLTNTSSEIIKQRSKILGETFHKYVCAILNAMLNLPNEVIETIEEQSVKTYEADVINENWKVIDASKYGISNVYEASQYFTNTYYREKKD